MTPRKKHFTGLDISFLIRSIKKLFDALGYVEIWGFWYLKPEVKIQSVSLDSTLEERRLESSEGSTSIVLSRSCSPRRMSMPSTPPCSWISG